MVVHAFNSRAQEAKAGNLSSRSAWSSQQVPGQQGYTEKPHLNRTKKQNMRNFVGEKKIFKKALCCFLVFPTTTIWLYCWVISPDPPKKVTFLIKKIIYSFIYLFLRKYLCFPGSLGLRNLVASVSLLECITISGTQKVTELQTHTHLCSCLGLSTLNLTFLSLYYILSAKVTQPCQYGWCCLKNQHQNLIHILQYKSLYTSFLYSYSTIS